MTTDQEKLRKAYDSISCALPSADAAAAKSQSSSNEARLTEMTSAGG